MKRYNFRILDAKKSKNNYMINKMFLNTEMSKDIFSRFKKDYIIEQLRPEEIENCRKIHLLNCFGCEESIPNY